MFAGVSDRFLAISVVKNSVAQVAAFLYPALVLISLLFAHQLTMQCARRSHPVPQLDAGRRRGGQPGWEGGKIAEIFNFL